MARRAVTEGGAPGFATAALRTGRPRALPAGRAVVGGFLVAVAAVVVFAASMAGASNHGRPWVVAAHSLAAGTILGPADLTTSSMRLPGATESQAFARPSVLLGRTLAVRYNRASWCRSPCWRRRPASPSCAR